MIVHVLEVLLLVFIAVALGSGAGWLLGRVTGRRPALAAESAPAFEPPLLSPVAVASRASARPVVAREPAPPARLPAATAVAEEPVEERDGASDAHRLRARSRLRAAAWRASANGEAVALLPPPRSIPGLGDRTDAHDWAEVPAPLAARPSRGREPPPIPDETWEPPSVVWPPPGPGDLPRNRAPALVGGPRGGSRTTRAALSSTALAIVALLPPPDSYWSDGADEQPSARPGLAVRALAAQPPPAESGRRPPGVAPPSGPRDNLRRIRGIGPGFERMLNKLGIHRIAQVAAWTEAEQRWVGDELGFPGRVERDQWVAQAASLLVSSASEAEVGRDP